MTTNEALKQLVEGNLRYTLGRPNEKNLMEARAAVVSEQHPYAVVLGCSDSRVPPELVFDATLGDLFVVRTAGHVIDVLTIGSIEYAVEHLHVPLILVLGHESCGAVTAAVEESEEPDDISAVVDSIQPAVEATKGMRGDEVDNAVRANTQLVVKELTDTSTIISEACGKGELRVLGARYELNTGRVQLLQ
jgi:carbonic anhydrase